jgi:hypothetical protein
MRRFGSIWLAICAAALALVLAPSARAADAPSGVVVVPHSPAGPETMNISVIADAADGGSLGTATLFVGGTQVGTPRDLCDPAGACAHGSAALPLDTTAFPDATYDVHVVVEDVDHASTVLDYPGGLQIWNDRPTGSSTATLSVGSSVPQPAPSGGGGGGSSGGVRGASAGSCTSPKLSMVLDQKPLRVRHGVPVLVANKRYRFTGRLTCVINGKRVSAPKRTRIDVRAIVHGRSAPKTHGSVGAKGKIVFRLASPSSRTLEFRFTGADSKVTRVRIKVETVKVKKHKKHKKG